jgi:predicted DNA-binding protein
MAKAKKKPAPTPTGRVPRHARIELPDEDYQRLKRVAERVHISVAAYIRQATMERIEADEQRG